MGAELDKAIRWALANPRAALVELSRIDCEASLAQFTREAWHVIEPTESLIWNWHLDVLCAYIQAFFEGRIRRLILNVSPGSMKSILLSVMGPAWKWTTRPGARMLNLTNAADLAKRDTRKMRDIVDSQWYRQRWGHRVQIAKDQNETKHIETTARGFRQGLGITGSITGKRGNYLLIDDAVDAKKAFSDVEIASANQSYDQAVSSRLNKPAVDGIAIIMQRLRTNDLTGHVLAKKASTWVHVRIPMEYDGEPGYDPVRDLGPQYAHLADPRKEIGELMFPELFTAGVVAERKEDLGEYGSSGQLQQRPSPLSGGIVKRGPWRIWPDDKPLPKIVHAFASWDTAFSERDLKESAYSACTVWGVWFDEKDGKEGRHKLLLLSAWWGRVDFPDLLAKAKEIEAEKLKHDHDAHLIEDMASGKSMIQTMRGRTKVRVLRYDPKNDGGGDKIARAYNVQPLFKAGMVWAPNKPWAQRVIEIIGEFPAGDALCKDVTDTATQAVNYLSKGWWIRHPDDDPDGSDIPAAAEIDEDEIDIHRIGTGRVYG
jgi:predicted phage terminase large subunit-like protein